MSGWSIRPVLWALASRVAVAHCARSEAALRKATAQVDALKEKLRQVRVV